MFGDAAFEEPVGGSLAEAAELDRALEVGRDGDDGPAARTVVVPLGEVGHRVAIGGAAVVALRVGERFSEVEVDVAVDNDVVVEAVAVGGAVGAELGEVARLTELGEGAVGHLVGERLAVVVVVVLDEGDALAHDCLQQEQGGGVGVRGLVADGGAEGGVERSVVVAIDIEDVPAVGDPRGTDVLRHDIGDFAADLESVEVDEGDEVVELVLGGKAAGLADLALLLLTVAHTDEGGEGGAAGAGRHGEAGANREALAEVAGVPLDAGDNALHVAAEDAAGPAKAAESLTDIEVSEARERGVDARRDVAVADDEAVAVGMVGRSWVERGRSVEDEERIERGEAAARMAGGGERDQANDVCCGTAAKLRKMGRLVH